MSIFRWPAVVLALLLAAGPVRAAPDLVGPWPDGEALQGIVVEPVRFASHSPFILGDVGRGPEVDPPTEAVGTLYLPAQVERHNRPSAVRHRALVKRHRLSARVGDRRPALRA